MAFIRIPEAVTNITNTTVMANKSVEITDLETHVMVCSLRYEALGNRLELLENKVNDMILQSIANNKLVVRAGLTVITGIVTSFLITHFKII